MQFVKLETNKGDIVISLNHTAAPKTVENFVRYAQEGFYEGTIFHRVIAGFMIQGGGMTVDMVDKDNHDPIPNEANNGLTNDHYTVAMARTMDPHSATSQFFINTKDNAFLNFTGENPQGWGYAVFGKVICGQEVVDEIENVNTTSRSYHDDVPEEPILINKATVLEEFDA